MRRVGSLVLCCFAFTVLALGCDALKPSEARAVLALHEALSELELSDEARETKLTELRALPVEDAEVARVREACVNLYDAMREADRHTAEARVRVDAYEATPKEARDPGEGEAIAALLGRSHEALRRAEDVREACLKGIQTLERRER